GVPRPGVTPMARSRPGRTVRAHRERGAKDRPGVDERVARRPATAGTGGAPSEGGGPSRPWRRGGHRRRTAPPAGGPRAPAGARGARPRRGPAGRRRAAAGPLDPGGGAVTGGAPRARPAGPGPRRGRADRAPIAAIGPRRRSLVGRMESVADLAARRRTFAIISHPDAGKTTLTEKFLLYGGAVQEAGQVKARGERRRARSDWMELEQKRGISITSAVLQFPYRGNVLNLLDTPGHRDFSEDTYRVLAAVDAAVMVLDAAKGIE